MSDRMKRSLMFQCTAQSDIWTAGNDPNGDYNLWCNEQRVPNDGAPHNPNGPQRQLHLTSILGGIRWWAEAIVRSFGGRACDPTERTGPNTLCGKGNLCLICKLFGNPNVPQAAKFALRCWIDETGHSPRTAALKKGETFYLEFLFFNSAESKRDPEAYEIWLLAKTLDLIASYGSIGGKTVFKPTAFTVTANNLPKLFRHSDFGLIQIKGVTISPDILASGTALDSSLLSSAIAAGAPVTPSTVLPNINYFWFVNGFTLNVHQAAFAAGTGSFNELLLLSDTPPIATVADTLGTLRRHVKGIPNERSKRVFSFKDPARTWGFVIRDEYACALTLRPGDEPDCRIAVETWFNTCGGLPAGLMEWGDTLKLQPFSFPVS